jgi:2-oxoglutarate ferredoxin oxidoreductase subunit gamma
VVDRFDAAVVMNLPSLRKFASRVASGGVIAMNTSLLGEERSGRSDVTEMHLLCTELAAKGGDDKLISVVALGALVARTGWVTPDSVRAALREMASRKRPEVVEADMGVFAAGLEAGRTEAVGVVAP